MLVVGSLVVIQPVIAGATVGGESFDQESAGTTDVDATASATGSVETVRAGSTASLTRDATPPETADEYLATFQEMEGSPAFEEYAEFETIRSLAVSKLQVVDFDDDTETEMRTVYELLVSFRASYQFAANGSTSASLDAANATAANVTALEEQGRTYAPLAEIAVSRFFENRGDEFLESATNASTTPAEIEALRRASVAYERAGASQKFSEVNLRYQQTQTEYRSDVRTMNAANATVESFRSSCASCSGLQSTVAGNGFATFDRYLETTDTMAALREAESLAEKHGLEDRATAFASTREEVAATRSTLAMASVAVLLSYGLLCSLVAMVVTHRLVTWGETVRAADVGEIVVLEEVNDA